MTYIDPEGHNRRADCGATVTVHSSHIARFDQLNVLAGEELEPEPVEPKSRARNPRKED
ncbi:hypothetical protein [Nocardia sp. NPDC058480]|uniref:hypothetical protein n=1 Tax=Nocardia sp. NPDC058480 TaxID=3346522 RepID=UPI0036521EAD